MKITYLLGLAAAGVLSSFISASAASITPVIAQCATDGASTTFPGTQDVTCGSADRRLADNVNLGAADGDFFSLGVADNTAGLGGLAIFEISPGFSGLTMVVEVTNPSNHFEAASVFVSNSIGSFGDATFVGQLNNGLAPGSTEVTTLDIAAGPWTYLWFQDVSRAVYANTGSTDGYDIDSIQLSAVPLPAGIVLLGSALFGLGAWRRRRPV